MLPAKLVFLDIDGVLNSNKWVWEHDRSNDQMEHLDPSLVLRLNRLHETTGCLYVLSSTWRILFYNDTRRGLRNLGFTGQIIDATPTGGRFRGAEIMAWIQEANFNGKFVILDDSDDMGKLLPYLIKCNADTGVTDLEIDQAIQVLNY
jgi:hypothetical protein